jgi:hypothetical protein
MDKTDTIRANFSVLREFILEHSDVEKMPKEGRRALKAALNLGEQLLVDIHTIARNGGGSP